MLSILLAQGFKNLGGPLRVLTGRKGGAGPRGIALDHPRGIALDHPGGIALDHPGGLCRLVKDRSGL